MLAMLFPCSWSLTIHPEPRLSSRQSTAKAGLAWANGPNVDINQYLTTGKVSWYASRPSAPRSLLIYMKVLLMVPVPHRHLPRICPAAMGHQPNPTMAIDHQPDDRRAQRDRSAGFQRVRSPPAAAPRAASADARTPRPQNPAQSNLTAQQGAALWMQYIQPLKAQGIRLGSPAPDSAPDGECPCLPHPLVPASPFQTPSPSLHQR
jgi:hypothetical protein